MKGLTEQEILDMRDRAQLAAKAEFPGEFARRIVAHIDAQAFQISTLKARVTELEICARDFGMLATRMARATTDAKLRELAGHALRIAEKAGVGPSPLRAE